MKTFKMKVKSIEVDFYLFSDKKSYLSERRSLRRRYDVMTVIRTSDPLDMEEYETAAKIEKQEKVKLTEYTHIVECFSKVNPFSRPGNKKLRKTKMYTPRIATHWTEAEAETTIAVIKNEALDLTEDEIMLKCQECCTEADKWNSKMIHDPSLQDSRDRMYQRWVADCSEMAAIWATVTPGKI